jgi:hypothetical protein
MGSAIIYLGAVAWKLAIDRPWMIWDRFSDRLIVIAEALHPPIGYFTYGGILWTLTVVATQRRQDQVK